MNRFSIGKIANVAIGFASESYILSQALNLKSREARHLAELAMLWQCSIDQATNKAQRIRTHTGRDLNNIVWCVKAGVQFPD